MTRRRAAVQRAFDLVVAVTALVVTSPLWPLLAAAIKLTSPGPVLYRAPRLGRDARLFTICKFRSMTHDDAAAGPSVTVAGDARVTGVGALLRRAKLDELPQLLNVVRGDMSIVGWRPEHPSFLDSYPDGLRGIFAFRPGITSPASLAYRHEEAMLAERGGDLATVYVQEVLPAKVAIDLDYLRGASLRSDLLVLLRTFTAVARVRR